MSKYARKQGRGSMAKKVNEAFDRFMSDVVNLSPETVVKARKSRDNLLDNINEFAEDNDFFELYPGFNFHTGSFARKTKCRELDDIDLMVGIASSGATYIANDPWDDVRIMASTTNVAQRECTQKDGTLNSTQVVNRFKRKLEEVREYSRSEIRRNGEAIVLNLISKDWSFDIVPCFHTITESNGRSYYLIPNGKGNWKKTAPDVDKGHVMITNQKHEGKVLPLIRLCKRWNKTKNATTIPSYMLETMIINFVDSVNNLSAVVDENFCKALNYIATNITRPIYDLKDIQGNINTLDGLQQLAIVAKAEVDCKKAKEACWYEVIGDSKRAIGLWGEIFGKDFPRYE
jgi:hypothetical protein